MNVLSTNNLIFFYPTMKHSFFMFVLLPLLLLFAFPFSAPSVEFRVENELQVGSVAETISSTTYLLNGGDFISMIGENGEITYFDAKNAEMTLLDPRLRLQAKMAADAMKTKVEQWRRKNTESTVPQVAFVARPIFQREFDPVSGRLSLQSSWFHYQITTEPYINEETGNQYYDFCDWSCYLNFRIDDHALPTPLVRLEVNRILRESKLFPKAIVVSYFPKGNQGFRPREEKAKSTHKIVTRRDEADQKRIAKVMEYMKSFTSVPFDVYQEKAKALIEKSK